MPGYHKWQCYLVVQNVVQNVVKSFVLTNFWLYISKLKILKLALKQSMLVPAAGGNPCDIRGRKSVACFFTYKFFFKLSHGKTEQAI